MKTFDIYCIFFYIFTFVTFVTFGGATHVKLTCGSRVFFQQILVEDLESRDCWNWHILRYWYIGDSIVDLKTPLMKTNEDLSKSKLNKVKCLHKFHLHVSKCLWKTHRKGTKGYITKQLLDLYGVCNDCTPNVVQYWRRKARAYFLRTNSITYKYCHSLMHVECTCFLARFSLCSASCDSTMKTLVCTCRMSTTALDRYISSSTWPPTTKEVQTFLDKKSEV